MAVDYTEDLEAARELIDEFGRNIKVRSNEIVGDGFDPTLIPTDSTVKAVQVGFKQGDIDGSRVKSTDKRFVIAYPGFMITKEMQFIDGDTVFYVPNGGQGVKEIKPGDTPIVYFVHVRS